jgi:hypothetical protein
MTTHCTTIAPFRIAEGEQEPEQCSPESREGWMTYTDKGPAYYYKTKREAATASEALQVGIIPSGGRPWWPSRTRYLA